jgi:hypothetical protein
MNILKLYVNFLQRLYLTPFKNIKINLSQFRPPFFDGIYLKYCILKNTPLVNLN